MLVQNLTGPDEQVAGEGKEGGGEAAGGEEGENKRADGAKDLELEEREIDQKK